MTVIASLWEQRVKVDLPGQDDTVVKTADNGCKPVKTRLQAASAMAILSIFASLSLLAVAILFSLGKRLFPTILIFGPAGLSAFLCMIAWILEANVYNTVFFDKDDLENTKECGQEAPKEIKGSTLSWSFALFLIDTVAFPVLAGAFWFLNKNMEGFSQV